LAYWLKTVCNGLIQCADHPCTTPTSPYQPHLSSFPLAQVALVSALGKFSMLKAAQILLSLSVMLGKRWASPPKGQRRGKIHSQEHGREKKTSFNSACCFFNSRNNTDLYP